MLIIEVGIMDNYNINHHFCYHIIPFAFNKDYIKAKNELNNRKNGEDKIWERKPFGVGQKVFEHVKKLICDNDEFNETIGIRYELQDNLRGGMGLPDNPKDKLVLRVGKNNLKVEEFEYYISKIHLYIFETQIGFLAFEICYDYDNANLTKIIESNYHIKFIAQNIEAIYMTNNDNINNKIDKPVLMEDVINKLTEDLTVSTFFENGTVLPKQAIVYNSICLSDISPDKDFIAKSIYEMRRLFKNSYLPTVSDLNVNDNEETLQLFENCYWAASLEGIVNIYHLTNKEETNDFFTTIYQGATDSTYLYIYLVALHQRYALLNYSIIASKIKKNNNIGKEDLDIIKAIKSEKLKFAYYNLRCTFKNLSNITHQNKIYCLIRKVLNIDDLWDEVNNELLGLAQILEDYEEKIEKADEKARKEMERVRDKKEEKRLNFLTIGVASLAAIFWLPSIVVAFWDIIDRALYDKIPFHDTWKLTISILLPIAFIAVPIMIILITNYIMLRKNKLNN